MTQQPHDAYADLAPSVGDRLRIARERRAKLSQGDFADLVNVSRGTVSNYERDSLPGGPRQRLVVFNSWAAACGVDGRVARDRSGPRPAGAGRGPKCGELARPEVFETPTF